MYLKYKPSMQRILQTNKGRPAVSWVMEKQIHYARHKSSDRNGSFIGSGIKPWI